MRDVAAENQRILKRLLVGVVAMFGFGFLLVPMYEKICEVTGINNILQPDRIVNTQVDTSRTVMVEFDANLHGLPWSFKPRETVMRVHPGELATVVYEVANTRDVPVTGQAIPSYGPQHAGRYFLKMECFCFAQQQLDAGEVREMPVAFVIDPSLPRDVTTITLSYTFFEVEGRQAQLGRQGDDAS
ncbi:cytochrome c oxidase assembly protein [Azoarcus taiwanensis]|uniref:Cytochrome c oxidase assembly protein CtaG n=1 Tax=Azoarcus taiwanensis TaxID=666964 RepID=A0A972F8U2_9RHOO|nr:cytochrome c oxidase assembly protein [Azoarcus taiwanensis]NMG04324.1 cytochrome c oxidase assembly protein [Azoarcus taiwanensis]